MVLDTTCKEGAISRLITSYVPKAEKTRRHGRELSFILPHNSVESFSSLFSAIEHEINTNTQRLGISSYGVSMTTLEEVFLHLEKDEEPECAVEDLSKKIVKNRAISRSLNLQSKSNSYQNLNNDTALIQENDPSLKGDFFFKFDLFSMFFNFLNFFFLLSEIDELSDGLTLNDKNPSIIGLGLDPIKIRPNFLQTLYAMVRLRSLRLVRNIQLLYFTILAPLGCVVMGLYLNSIQTVEVKMRSLLLNNGKAFFALL